PRPGQTEAVRKTVFARKFAPWNTTISYGLYVDDIDADVRALTLELAAIGGGLMLLMAALSWLIARDVLGALDRQKNRMQEISEGAIDRPVEETGRG
ncbi:cache domain-containing protein, partial [Acinetobacter baumannii]